MKINCQECNGRGVYDVDGKLKSCKTCDATGRVECPCETNQKHLKEQNQKTRWDLLPWAPIAEIAEIITMGAPDHGEESWREETTNHHFAAAMRHMTEWRKGKKISDDYKKRHLLHAAARLIFIVEIEGGKENA